MLRNLTAVSLLTALAGSAAGQSFNIELGAAAGLGAAAVPSSYAACGQPGHWNEVVSGSPSGILLRDLANNLTAVTMIRPTGQNAAVPVGNADSGDFASIMADGIPVNTATNTDTYAFSNLQPGRYLVYVYFTNAPSGINAVIDATGHIGESLPVTGGSLPGIYGAGANYSVTLGDVSGSGALDVRIFRVAGGQANVAAIQLVKLDGGRKTLYINDNPAGDNSGTSWTNAMPSIHAAANLLEAMYAFETEVSNNTVDFDLWVAGGTYTATPFTSPFFFDREASLTFYDGTRIYGGFAGTESQLDQRQFGPNTEVIITGSIGGPGADDNTRTVMRLNGCGETTLIEHVTIRDGHDNTTGLGYLAGRGGGVEILPDSGFPSPGNDSGPVFRDVIFRNNAALREGGAVWVNNVDPTFVRCVFEANSAKLVGNTDADGGAVYALASDPTFVDCTFTNNTAWDDGAALYLRGNGESIDLVSCRVSGNTGGSSTIHVDQSPVDIINTLISGNTNGFNAAAVYANGEAGDILFSSSTVAHNTAFGDSSGVLLANGADGSVFNSILWGNTGTTTNPGFEGEDSFKIVNGPTFVAFANSTVENGTAMQIPFNTAQYLNSLANPMFIDPDGADNVIGNGDDDFRLQNGSPAQDSGDITFVPLDDYDLDGNGVTFENIPLDLDGNDRFVDLPAIGLSGLINAIDRGALESQIEPCGPSDLNRDGLLDLSDVTMFGQAFLSNQPLADLALPTGTFDLSDINAFVSGFLAGCP